MHNLSNSFILFVDHFRSNNTFWSLADKWKVPSTNDTGMVTPSCEFLTHIATFRKAYSIHKIKVHQKRKFSLHLFTLHCTTAKSMLLIILQCALFSMTREFINGKRSYAPITEVWVPWVRVAEAPIEPILIRLFFHPNFNWLFRILEIERPHPKLSGYVINWHLLSE